MTGPLKCSDCWGDRHCNGEQAVATGRMVPDRDPLRDRDRMLREYVRCQCQCGSAEK